MPHQVLALHLVSPGACNGSGTATTSPLEMPGMADLCFQGWSIVGYRN